MMNELKARVILKEAWRSARKDYFVWLGGLLPVGLPFFWLLWILLPRLADGSSRSLRLIALLAFLLIFAFAYINKFALVVVRNPQLVKRHFFRAVWYCIRDGLPTRLVYAFIILSLQLLILLALWPLFGRGLLALGTLTYYQLEANPLSVVVFIMLAPIAYLLCQLLAAYFIDSHFFLLPYIMQDTSSADNFITPLSLTGSLRKSVSLMSRYRNRYVLLTLQLMSIILAIASSFGLVVGALKVAVGSAFDRGFVFLGLLLSSFLIIFFLAARTLFANKVMEYDREIVDFGD